MKYLLTRNPVARITEEISSGLYSDIFDHITNIEREFEDSKGGRIGFLWEHTLRVASLALKIGRKEKTDLAAVTLAALFHDAGKFYLGSYHSDETPEEEIARDVALRIMKDHKVDASLSEKVIGALDSLYREEEEEDILAHCIHDADFLDKMGILGVGTVFQRAALRGDPPSEVITRNLSREMTYARYAVELMRTAEGRRRAVTAGRDSLRFYRRYIREFNALGLGVIEESRHRIDTGNDGEKSVIVLVSWKNCPLCGKKTAESFSSSDGVKCVKISAVISCKSCHYNEEISFCRPELPGMNG
jgi:HD superfamily phosphodiesterase